MPGPWATCRQRPMSHLKSSLFDDSLSKAGHFVQSTTPNTTRTFDPEKRLSAPTLRSCRADNRSRVAQSSSSQSTKGISRRDPPPRSGISRLVPRGTFSTSHFPNGIRWAGACSCQTRSGTTMNDDLLPMRCGPTVSARRRISDSLAFASAMVQTRWESGRCTFRSAYSSP